MSWFARSIANTLKFDDDDGDDEKVHNQSSSNQEDLHKERKDREQLIQSSSSPRQGVKEDFSELTKTLTRQFWGVASFLAPPPPPDSSPSDGTAVEKTSESDGIYGIRSDFAEIGGRFRSGISKLSNNLAVSEITKMASNFLQLGPGEEDDYGSASGAVGVTGEVVAFVRDIAMHPETWLDFPWPDEEEDEDFELSDVQQEHALAVERLAPRLAALRIELCPGYMSEDSFWKIYFVLLHPRLDKSDAELLSTPVIVKARALFTRALEHRSKAYPEQDATKSIPSSSKDVSSSPREEHLFVPSSGTANAETEKHMVPSSEIQVVDKSVIQEESPNPTKTDKASTSEAIEVKDEDDGDDWLKDENSETVVGSGTQIPIENEEDVSFSDLEEDDGDVPTSYKKMTYNSDSSAKDSRDWVQLGRSSFDSMKDTDSISVERTGPGQVSADKKESTDWLDLDDIDVA